MKNKSCSLVLKLCMSCTHLQIPTHKFRVTGLCAHACRSSVYYKENCIVENFTFLHREPINWNAAILIHWSPPADLASIQQHSQLFMFSDGTTGRELHREHNRTEQHSQWTESQHYILCVVFGLWGRQREGVVLRRPCRRRNISFEWVRTACTYVPIHVRICKGNNLIRWAGIIDSHK